MHVLSACKHTANVCILSACTHLWPKLQLRFKITVNESVQEDSAGCDNAGKIFYLTNLSQLYALHLLHLHLASIQITMCSESINTLQTHALFIIQIIIHTKEHQSQ